MFKRFMRAMEALEALIGIIQPIKAQEIIPVQDSVGRVLSEGIVSAVDLPEFNRAAMDGYAVRSSDTRSASTTNPVYLNLGENVTQVRTGMAVPDNFDAVVMLEETFLRGKQLEVMGEVHPFRNVSRTGEDIAIGDLIFKEGHRIRPPDIALLAALGIKGVFVYARPKIAILPTGGELVAIGARSLLPGEAYEINGLMARLYVEKWGGLATVHDIVPDDPELIRAAIESNLDADMIILIGGTSVGEKDYAPKVLAEMGDLLVHGVRIQPGKPTAFGSVQNKPVVCLPGYPVAALADLYLFVRPALKKLTHLNDAVPKTTARLARKIASKTGYLSIVRVKIEGEMAMPIMTSGAGILSSVARADGFVTVPEELEGIEAGEMVEVTMIE
jgi:molybdopterin molybdotransferase